jgi:cytochrome P450
MLRYYGILGLQKYFIPKDAAGARAKNMKMAIDTVKRRIEKNTDRKDFLHYILAANAEKGMSIAEINVNAFSFSIAGSESTATAMSGAMYQILTNRDIYQKLVNEIRGAFAREDDITLASTNALAYLDCVLTETLRVYPPVAITLPRVVPSGGETIDGGFVHGGVTVGINHYSCYRDPQNFSRPDQFLPERWSKNAEDDQHFFAGDRPASFQPFSFGPRNCLGKNVARAEMRLVMARLLWRYDLEAISIPKDWIDQQQIFGFWVKPALLCRLSLVERE